MKSQCISSNGHPRRVARLHLNLEVHDPDVVAFLGQFEGPQRAKEATAALRAGVIAIQSGRATVDTEAMDRLLAEKIGPGSPIWHLLDPGNKNGLHAQLEKLIKTEGARLVRDHSLENSDSSISRMHQSILEGFDRLALAVGASGGRKVEAKRGHIKGLEFQDALYLRIAELGRAMGDQTEFVGNTPGPEGRKPGDFLITLGDSSAAPGSRIVIEAKKRICSWKDSIKELRKAKENRSATCGIIVFAKGCEPPEVGDFRIVGEDILCTACEELFDQGEGAGLLYISAAYQIGRAMLVMESRTDLCGGVDKQRLRIHLDALSQHLEAVIDLRTADSSC